MTANKGHVTPSSKELKSRNDIVWSNKKLEKDQSRKIKGKSKENEEQTFHDMEIQQFPATLILHVLVLACFRRSKIAFLTIL